MQVRVYNRYIKQYITNGKTTSSLKIIAFSENFFFARNTLYKSWEGNQNFRFMAAVVKKLL